MVNNEIRLIIFFVAKDTDTLYSQQKQDRELTVAKIRSSLLPNSDLNWRKYENPLIIQIWSNWNPLLLYNGNDKKIDGIRSDRQNAWGTMKGGSWNCTEGSDQDQPQEKERQNGCLRRPYK